MPTSKFDSSRPQPDVQSLPSDRGEAVAAVDRDAVVTIRALMPVLRAAE